MSCGTLPGGPASSESSPRALAVPAARAKTSCARSSSPAAAWHWLSQNEASRNGPSSAPVHRRSRPSSPSSSSSAATVAAHARVGAVEQADEGHEQDARVEVVRAERARVGAAPGVPGVAQQDVAQRVALGGPARTVAADRAVQPHRTVERDPAVELGDDVVPLALAPLPDARVGLPPLPRRAVGQLAQERAGELVRRAERVAQHPGAVEHVAEHVELLLAPRRVADAHRGRAAMAGEVRELVLVQGALALDAEEDLDVVLVAAAHGRAGDPLEVAQRLVAAGRGGERGRRHRRVAQPDVAVVPVRGPALLLGQRRRGRRDDAARRLVREPLDDEARAMDGRLVQPVVAAVLLGPGAPGRDRVGQRGVRVERRRRLGEGAGHAVEHPAGAVALPQRRRGHGLAALDRERAVAAQEEPFRARRAWRRRPGRRRARGPRARTPAAAGSATRARPSRRPPRRRARARAATRGRSGGRGRRARTRARR